MRRFALLVIPILLASSVRAQSCNLLCNSDFEEWPTEDLYPQFVNASVFPCWSTTASDNIIEVWTDPNYEGDPGYSGNHFIELNANEVSALYQDFTATPGAAVTIGVAHCARLVAPDVMSVDIGHDGTFTTVATVSDGLTWGHHTYTYTLPSGGSSNFTLRFTSISSGYGSPTVGNFIDDVSIQVEGNLPQLSLASTATCAGLTNGTASAEVVGGTAPFTYAWSPTTSANASMADLAPGSYTCIVTDANGCKDTSTVVVDEWPVPVVSMTSTAASCHDSLNGTASVTVTDGTLPYTYTWIPSTASASDVATGLAAGTYTCDVADANGCAGSASTTVTEPTVVTVSGSDVILCLGNATTLQAVAGGGTPGYTLAWSPEGPNVAPDTTTRYTVVATDAHGCLSTMDTVTVTVPILPPVAFTTDTTTGCAPACIAFTTEPYPDLSFHWQFGDGEGANTPDILHCYPLGGIYDISLTLTDPNGCSSTVQEEDLISVWTLPTAHFNASAWVVTLDEPVVDFTDQSIGATQWLWDFANGSGTSTGPSPSFRFEQIGCPPVILTVTDTHGCMDTDSLLICVKDVSSPFVPNAFTPDGDGINDVLKVINVPGGADSYAFTIYDRWGSVLFASSTPDQGWDGSGTPTGLYTWRLRYRDSDGLGAEHLGHVTLLR